MRFLVAHTLDKAIGVIFVSHYREDLCLCFIMSLGSKRSHEVLLAPEPIDVDDSWDSVMHGDNNHTNTTISSPDELNIRSPSTEGAHSSKYQFNTPRHDSTDRNNNPPIAPDGANTEWATKKFFQGSSHILNGNPTSSGQVREKIAKIEAQTHIQKIDLTRKVKLKSKMKSKVRPLFFPSWLSHKT